MMLFRKTFPTFLLNKRLLLPLSIFLSCSLLADNFALLGGGLDKIFGPTVFDESYQAGISFPGKVSNLTGDVPNGIVSQIFSVSINQSGAGLIGGGENFRDALESVPYAAIISPSGVATKVTGEIPVGGPSGGNPFKFSINSVSINKHGVGLIGGSESGTVPYAAMVSPSGVATRLTGDPLPPIGAIFGVVINDNGNGLIAGAETGVGAAPYAAIVSPIGVVTNLTGEVPVVAGSLVSAAFNNNGVGLIGGREFNPTAKAYVAMVSPSGVAKRLTGDAPSDSGIVGNDLIGDVAINNSGKGLIVGVVDSLPYAAMVSPSGVATKITIDTPAFRLGSNPLRSVAINDSGMGLVGGNQTAVMVSPSGTVTPLRGEVPQDVFLRDVAINNVGIGLIAGDRGLVATNDHRTYAAFVSPAGYAIQIPGANILAGSINSVDIADFANRAVPSSWGPSNSYVNDLFALSTQVLPNHTRMVKKQQEGSNPKNLNKEVGLLTDASDMVRGYIPCQENFNYSLWLSPFGLYAHNKKEQEFPSLTNWSGGIMLGFDYHGIQQTIIGVGAAYAFNRVDYSDDVGHARFHQEFLTLYGSWGRDNIVISAALWGGAYQMHNKRSTLRLVNSKANVNGWLLNPHFELSTPLCD